MSANLSPNDEAATLLIVDDSRVNREMMRLSLARHGYKFLTAANGQEAVEVLRQNPEVDLIILDLVMPHMDGFEFLRWRAQQPEAVSIPVIVNSSLDDVESIHRALGMDSYDYFTKPLEGRDLDLVLPLKIKNAVNAHRLMTKTRQQNEIMARELDMAGRYQQFLLPHDVQLPGVKVAHRFKPSSLVGGDYFDFFTLPGGELAFVVADVAGHGVAAAMTASIIKALLPGLMQDRLSPAEALTALNDNLLELTQEDTFVTAFAALYKRDQNELVWSQAGHPPPLLLGAGGGMDLLWTESTFLGVFEAQSGLLDVVDHSAGVSPGHRLVMYTDGLIEAPGHDQRLFGLERLKDMVARNTGSDAEGLCQAVWRDLRDFAPEEMPDDVALIVMDFVE